MQVVILAGGFGTRLSEETDFIPKPMVRIGNIPVLRHIMNYYAQFEHKNFVIALGYKADVITKYFEEIQQTDELQGWNVQLVDTGLDTATGGRLKKLDSLLENQFLMTYGDGLSNVNIEQLVQYHRKKGLIATLTAVKPPPRFGVIQINDGQVTRFAEKHPDDASWVNGGFFFLEKRVLDFIKDDSTSFENDSLEKLVENKQLAAFQHTGWWQPMDTLRDKRTLESIWQTDKAPWIKN